MSQEACAAFPSEPPHLLARPGPGSAPVTPVALSIHALGSLPPPWSPCRHWHDASTLIGELPGSGNTATSFSLVRSGSALSLSIFQATTARDAGPLGSCSDSLAAPAGDCPEGTAPDFNLQAGSPGGPVHHAMQCLPCSPGSACAGGAMLTCPAGTYSDLVGASRCERCPAGTTSLAGEAACWPAPEALLSRRRS